MKEELLKKAIQGDNSEVLDPVTKSVWDLRGISEEELIATAKEILSELRKKPEIDYEKSSELMYKLIQQFLKYYTDKFDEDGMKNIVIMNKVNIANDIYRQMISD